MNIDLKSKVNLMEPLNPKSSTITLTFGDQAENHVGMQKIGKMADEGFSVEELQEIFENSDKEGMELINLNEKLEGTGTNGSPASLLILRDGVDRMLGEGKADEMFKEQSILDFDKKAFMYGKVVNKHARYNLCFDDQAQEPDYSNKKGRIIAFKDVPLLEKLRSVLPNFLGDKAKDLAVEGNYYYDLKKNYISMHGDAERKIVVAIRLGSSFPLYYQWYHNSKPIGERIKLMLDHGDIYVMSEKAVGTDWKSRSKVTLRHAAGSEKALKLK